MNAGQLHRAILEEAAIYFGWNNFTHYKRARKRVAKKLVDQVYHLSTLEKQTQLNAIRSVSAYEKEFGMIVLTD